MKKLLLLVLVSMTLSYQSFASISCIYAQDKSKDIQVIISLLAFDQGPGVLVDTVPAVTLIEKKMFNNKRHKEVSYHQTMEDRLYSPTIYLIHKEYDHLVISENSFLKDPDYTKVFLYRKDNSKVELTCFNQSEEVKLMFFSN